MDRALLGSSGSDTDWLVFTAKNQKFFYPEVKSEHCFSVNTENVPVFPLIFLKSLFFSVRKKLSGSTYLGLKFF